MKDRKVKFEGRSIKDYMGSPRCRDCGWKLNSPLTRKCPCVGGNIDLFVKELAVARSIRDKYDEDDEKIMSIDLSHREAWNLYLALNLAKEEDQEYDIETTESQMEMFKKELEDEPER